MDYFVYMDCDPGHVAIGGIYFRNTLHRTLKIKRAVVAREPEFIENGLHPITHCLISSNSRPVKGAGILLLILVNQVIFPRSSNFMHHVRKCLERLSTRGKIFIIVSLLSVLCYSTRLALSLPILSRNPSCDTDA